MAPQCVDVSIACSIRCCQCYLPGIGPHDFAHVPRDYVCQYHMSILFLLDVLTRSKNISIDHIFDFTAFCTKQCNSIGSILLRQAYSIDDVERVATGTDTEHHIAWLNQVCQLLSEDVLIGGIIAPRSN